MYHSRDASGEDRATTGIVTYPEAPAPGDGWPVVSYAHGTAGMVSMCAPSRDGRAAPGWGVEGVWAATDYVGLGPIGEIHPYLSKPSEGNAVIDIVTAARQVPESGAGKQWVAVGHSQGGHAALAAHDLAAQRVPGLELVATAAIAPAVGIHISHGVDEQLMTVLTMMQLYGAATEHDNIDIGDYLTGEAVEGVAVFRTGCVDEIVFGLTPSVNAGSFKADPWTTEPASSILRGNRVGTRAVEGVPVFLASGTDDLTVVPARVGDFFATLCALDQPTVLREVEDADHGSIIPLVFDEVGEFLNSALDNSALDNSALDNSALDNSALDNSAAPVPDDCP
jgi:pimeloyl-ACP methyl ester carboxylesterase